MCIIIVKPSGTKMPSDDTLMTCFENNPHGAGVSYSSRDGVVFIKGLMTYDAFKNVINGISNKTDRDIVMHFRITTSGGTRPDMCHPFNIGNMISPHKSDCVLHHNGILFNPMTKWYSDTAIFAWMLRKNFDKAINLYMKKYSMTNRFAIHLPTGVVTLGSGWIEDKDGCTYSNESYIPWKSTYSRFRDDNILLPDYTESDGVCSMCGEDGVYVFELSMNEVSECQYCGHVELIGGY